MLVGNKKYRSIWLKEGNDKIIQVIDQRYLPHQFVIEDLVTVNDILTAIRDMHIRGAGLIGVTAGYGMYLAALEAVHAMSFNESILEASKRLKATRPTAVNLELAIDRQLASISKGNSVEDKITIAKEVADEIAENDAECSRKIGLHGLELIEMLSRKKKGATVNILTHCNAGWLAFVDYGTATAPIYEAFKRNIKLHVWVDETRPRNQGANLTAWELGNEGIPHTIIVDNAGGHLMQHGKVDIVITGADRVTRYGDAANKIGTYLKALAAFDNNIPFYMALPSTSIDWSINDGLLEIPIEERNADEVKYIQGMVSGELKSVLVTPEQSRAANYGFDVTPARLITGFITENGICKPGEFHLLGLSQIDK
jgi:methylthioribose-1-phosphate isomerase